MKVLKEYKGSHHYWEDYEKTGYFCPSCGKKDVWEQCGSDDYYVGSAYVCVNCSTSHYLDNSSDLRKDEHYVKIIEQLKTGKAHEPTTPPPKPDPRMRLFQRLYEKRLLADLSWSGFISKDKKE